MAIKMASRVSPLSPSSGEVSPLLPRLQLVCCHNGTSIMSPPL